MLRDTVGARNPQAPVGTYGSCASRGTPWEVGNIAVLTVPHCNQRSSTQVTHGWPQEATTVLHGGMHLAVAQVKS